MKEQFAPYELALELKELGFDEPCVCVFNRDRALKSNITSSAFGDKITKDNYDVRLNAPLWQQAFDWFRNEYKLSGNVGHFGINSYSFVIDFIDNKNFQYRHIYNNYTYEEARLECLKKLIELCQEQ